MLTAFLCLLALAAAKPVDDSAPSSLAVPPVGSDTPRGSDDAASRPKATARYDDGRPPLIVMKGERHAGTNFLTGILETSLGDIRVTGGGSDPDPMTSCNPFAPEPPRTYCCWKHGYASTWCHGFQSPDAPVMRGGVVKSLPAHVFLIRSPYSWVLAMHDEPYDYNGILSANFSEFLRTPFSYVPRDYQGSSLADKPHISLAVQAPLSVLLDYISRILPRSALVKVPHSELVIVLALGVLLLELSQHSHQCRLSLAAANSYQSYFRNSG